MRWAYFLPVVLLATLLQTSAAQVLWFPTPVGWIGPELLGAVAVFVALNVRSGVDAALAGWTLGFAVDLTGSGEGLGLLALLYAAGSAGVFRVRSEFFSDRPMTQALMALGFCLFVYQSWAGCDVLLLSGSGAEYPRRVVQALGVSAYTALLSPLVCAVLGRVQRLLLAAPAAGRRR